jgi:hypothetical protein
VRNGNWDFLKYSLKNQINDNVFDIETKNSNIKSYSSREKIKKCPLIYEKIDIIKINICFEQTKIFSEVRW